uniref:Putative secreted protein n=2 Tax=argyritarsis section TaxID=44545 RepID=A0A2M4DM72_ANODA
MLAFEPYSLSWLLALLLFDLRFMYCRRRRVVLVLLCSRDRMSHSEWASWRSSSLSLLEDELSTMLMGL